MAKKKPALSPEEAKLKRLRELREADEAERRARGIWGALSVGEIQHQLTKSVFVLCYRGNEAPDPTKQARIRSTHVSPADHLALIEWLGRRPIAEYSARLVAWSLSDAEARRIRSRRIDEMRAVGTEIINAPEAVQPAA